MMLFINGELKKHQMFIRCHKNKFQNITFTERKQNL